MLRYMRLKNGKIIDTSTAPRMYKLIAMTEYGKNHESQYVAQSSDIKNLCDSFEVVRWDGYTFKYKSFADAYDRWFSDGYQNVSSEMYGIVDGKRVAIMRGYTEGKHPDVIEMELL